MDIITYSEARQNLKKMMEACWNNNEPIVITNKQGKHVVMMSFEDYEALDETSYLLSNEENRNRLSDAIKEPKSKMQKYKNTDKLLDDIENWE